MNIIQQIPIIQTANLRARHQQTLSLRRLEGFQKTHQVPTKASDAAKRFLGSLVSETSEKQIQELHTLLRREFGLTRKAILAGVDEYGCGYLESAAFRYQTLYQLDERNPDEVHHEILLDQIQDLQVLVNSSFTAKFSRFEIQLNCPMDVEKLIDRTEELVAPQNRDLQINYSLDATRCEFTSHVFPAGRVTFEKEQIILTTDFAQPLQRLLNELNHYESVFRQTFL